MIMIELVTMNAHPRGRHHDVSMRIRECESLVHQVQMRRTATDWEKQRKILAREKLLCHVRSLSFTAIRQ
jgi:hypothetical protein